MKVFTLKIRSEKIPNPIRVIEPKRAMISTLNFIRLFLIYTKGHLPSGETRDIRFHSR